eukprot:1153239-Pelagomonas_calceolata.AAC.2
MEESNILSCKSRTHGISVHGMARHLKSSGPGGGKGSPVGDEGGSTSTGSIKQRARALCIWMGMRMSDRAASQIQCQIKSTWAGPVRAARVPG